MGKEDSGQSVRVPATTNGGGEATVVFYVTTPAEQRRDMWKLAGIWVCAAVFVGMAVWAVFADAYIRNANKATLQRLEVILNRLDEKK
jgi:hypothetical protein